MGSGEMGLGGIGLGGIGLGGSCAIFQLGNVEVIQQLGGVKLFRGYEWYECLVAMADETADSHTCPLARRGGHGHGGAGGSRVRIQRWSCGNGAGRNPLATYANGAGTECNPGEDNDHDGL